MKGYTADNAFAIDCSAQVRKLRDAAPPQYRKDEKLLYEVLKGTQTINALHQSGFKYLVDCWYVTGKRKCGRRGFANVYQFCRHVGPRPSRRHQLHRLDNCRGYEPGNVEWQPQVRGGVQALVKSNTRRHLWNGKRLSHAELAAEINKRGGSRATEASIAKQYERLRKQTPQHLLTETIVKKHGLAFEHSSCPVENWDFPADMPEARAAYAHYHNGKNRLEFAIGYLNDRAQEEGCRAADKSLPESARDVYSRLAAHFRKQAADLDSQWSRLHRLKAEKQAVRARLKRWDLDAPHRLLDLGPQLHLFLDSLAEAKGLREDEEESWPYLEEAVKSEEALGRPGASKSMREACEIAIALGLPYPYPHAPHYAYPKRPPPGALEHAHAALRLLERRVSAVTEAGAEHGSSSERCLPVQRPGGCGGAARH